MLREWVDYNPDTGVFTWRKHPNHKIPAGAVIGTVDKLGYVRARVFGTGFAAHHLAWFYVYGEWPELLDHINRKRDDNRISNLRRATQAQNIANRGGNGPGLKGTTQNKNTGRWKAQIGVNRKNVVLGTFDTQEEAHEAYRVAAQYFFGEFAQTASKPGSRAVYTPPKKKKTLWPTS